MMRKIMAVAVLVLVAGLAWANDTAIQGASGSVAPMGGEHASIRMVDETVRMDVYPRYYDVRAEFLFHNTGKAATVTMGFPETGSGDGYQMYDERSAFQSFRTTVDGKAVTARRQLGKAPHEMSYLAWWTKEVSFAAGQQRRVTVEYRAPVGEAALQERWALYHFTGGNWAGTVACSRLLVRLHLRDSYAVWTSVPLRPDADGMHAVWHDWEAEETAVVAFQPCGNWDMAVRGLDIPREDDDFNWLSPRVHIRHFRAPGVADPDVRPFIPAAFMNEDEGGTAYIALRALKEFFTKRRPDLPAPEIDWNAATKTATLSYLGERLQFSTAGDAAPGMLHAVMKLYPEFYEQRSVVYVPADRVMQQCGGSVWENYADHLLTVNFPTPKACLIDINGNPCRVVVRNGEVRVISLKTGEAIFHSPYAGAVEEAIGLFMLGQNLLLPLRTEGGVALVCLDVPKSVDGGRMVESWRMDMSDSTLLPAADGRALYRIVRGPEGPGSVEKLTVADGASRWRQALMGIPAVNRIFFSGEHDGCVALYHARPDGDGITDPGEMLLFDAQTGAPRLRYWCGLDDVASNRLPHVAAGPADTRALLETDGLLLAGTYGRGLWQSSDGAAWTRITDETLPAYIVSLAAGRQGDIAAGTWMQEGILYKRFGEKFRLLPWPMASSWWSREYSRCLTVGFCGETLYVQTLAGFLRWTPGAGWERTGITAAAECAAINDSGIWTACVKGKQLRIGHYTPVGACDLDVPVTVSTNAVRAIATAGGQLYLLTAEGGIVSCTPADLRGYAAALGNGRHPTWAPAVTQGSSAPSRTPAPALTIGLNNAFTIFIERGYRPEFITGTSRGLAVTTDESTGQQSAMLKPPFAGFTYAAIPYQDITGEWLVLGGKDGIVMLPASVVRLSTFAAEFLEQKTEN